MYLWDAEKKEMKPLHQGRRPATTPEDFDPASKALYYLTNDGGEFTRVRRYDIASGRHEDVEKADWDVMYTYFSRGGTLPRHRRSTTTAAPSSSSTTRAPTRR